MNQRIKELIAQAREPLHNTNLPFNQGLMEYSEKFAELIVRECMDVVAKKCASPTAYNALVKHFGVEE